MALKLGRTSLFKVAKNGQYGFSGRHGVHTFGATVGSGPSSFKQHTSVPKAGTDLRAAYHRPMATQTHLHVNTATAIGGAVAAGVGYKLYQNHKINKHMKQMRQMRETYHQPHAGVPQAATFHQTHYALGSGGF